MLIELLARAGRSSGHTSLIRRSVETTCARLQQQHSQHRAPLGCVDAVPALVHLDLEWPKYPKPHRSRLVHWGCVRPGHRESRNWPSHHSMMTQIWPSRQLPGGVLPGVPDVRGSITDQSWRKSPLTFSYSAAASRNKPAAGEPGRGPTGITADRQAGAQSAKSPGQGWYACARPDQGTSDPG